MLRFRAMARLTKRILTLSTLSRRSDVSLAHLSKVYTGTRKLSAKALLRVAAAQHLSMEQVLRQIEAEVRAKKSKAA